MKIEQTEINQMLTPVFAALEKQKGEPQTLADRAGIDPAPYLEATPPIARESENLDKLSTQQLVDRMIACGAILAKRRQ